MMPVSAIATWTRGRLIDTGAKRGDITITGAVIDTRVLQPGNLFVAIRGERVDGHDFGPQAVAAGAAAALVERRLDIDLPQVLVNNTQLALGDLASAVRAQRHARMVGITGSNGKTTVKSLVAAILSLHGRTHVSAGNFNNELGLPLTLLAMPEDAEYGVLEMGAGKPGDIAYLAAIARPDVGVVNTIAPAHLERMGGVEGIAETKGALYEALPADGVAIINADDAFAGFFTRLAGARRVLRFGLDHPADVGADIVQLRLDGAHFIISTPLGDADVHLPLAGRHNVANALAASAVALALDVPLATIVQGLQQVARVAGRLHLEAMDGGWSLIDDSYNANPGSTGVAIDTLALATGERWLVLGDMAELGADAQALHAGIGERARRQGIEKLFAVGPLSAAAAAAFGDGAEHFADRNALTDALQTRLHAGVICLVKGSRSAGMEQVVAALRTPVHGGATHAA